MANGTALRCIAVRAECWKITADNVVFYKTASSRATLRWFRADPSLVALNGFDAAGGRFAEQTANECRA